MDHKTPAPPTRVRRHGLRQELEYLVQSPQDPVVINIRNDKSAIGECVNHISGLLVDLDSVNISLFSSEPN